jgi:hypothetical protein
MVPLINPEIAKTLGRPKHHGRARRLNAPAIHEIRKSGQEIKPTRSSK